MAKVDAERQTSSDAPHVMLGMGSRAHHPCPVLTSRGWQDRYLGAVPPVSPWTVYQKANKCALLKAEATTVPGWFQDTQARRSDVH